MAERDLSTPGADALDPEEILAGAGGRTPDHEPTDADEREVELDDPEDVDPPIDDRDPASEPPEGESEELA